MKLLIERGLMFGNLIRVNSPAWIGFYNRALEKLTGKRTALTEFHIDLAGFSPEIGDELGDLDYLSPKSGNRQFILLTTEQRSAPLLNADFSVLRDILRRFIVENESQLFSLTARDAVVGEIDSLVWRIAAPADLLGIKQIQISADTTGNHVAEADQLTALIDRFRAEPDAWWDDVLIARMIEQARKTGDVLRNPVHLQHTPFDVPDFRSSEFGGVYVFRSPSIKAMIFVDPAQKVRIPGIVTMSLDQPNEIAAWMARAVLTEAIVSDRSGHAAPTLRQKIDFILIDAAVRLGIDTGGATRMELRRAAGRMGDALPPEIRGLSGLLRYAEQGGDWPVVDSADPAYFYALRARPGPARHALNMLLTELAPHDLRALFIMNKALFYRRYQGWDPKKQAYVADHLAREYLVDKQGTREALFGPEPSMAEEPAPEPPPRPGPWGAPRIVLDERKTPVPASPWGPAR